MAELTAAKPVRLTRYFASLGLVVMGIGAIAVSQANSTLAVNQMHEVAEQNNRDLTKAFADSLWPDYSAFAHSAGNMNADEIRAHPQNQRLKERITALIVGTRVMKVKIYDLGGLTVFSSEPSQIGASDHDNPGFLVAREGTAASELEFRDRFNSIAGPVENRWVLSSYVPIFGTGGRASQIEGVAEVYSDITDMHLLVRRTEFVLLSVVGITFLVLSIAFLAIIRRVNARIKRASADVERQVVERTKNLDHSNAALRESEQRFRDFAESASDGLWETDTNLRFSNVWGRIMEGLREEGQEPIGKTRWEYVGGDPINDEHWRKHREDLDARRPFRDFEYSYVNSRGRQHRRASGKPIYDAEGSFAGYRGIVENTTATVEAKQEVRRVQVLLEHAIQGMPMGVALYDAEDRLVMRNNITRDFGDAAESVKVGAEFEALVRASVAAHIVPEAAGREEEYILERLERHRSPTGPFLQSRAGRLLEIREHRLPDGATIVTQIDVTEKHAAEEALRASQETLRLFMDSTTDRFLILDGGLNFVDANRAVIEAHETTKEELVGRNLSVVAPQAKPSGRYGKYLEVIRTGAPCRFEFDEVSPLDGQTTYLSASAFKVGDGLGITVQDITERKLGEISLRESEQRFSTAFHGSPSMMVLSDASSARILDVNEAWLEALGFEREEVIGRTSLELGFWVDAEERNALFEELNRVGRVRGFDVRWRTTAGREISAAVCVETLEQEGGPVMLSVSNDVTLQAEVERALIEAKERAEIASRTKSEFLANMSHELRTPLNAIIGFSEIMRAETFGPLGHPKYGTYANDIHLSGEHLLAVISDILDLSKIESGRDELEMDLIEVPSLLNDVSPLVARQAEDRDITLEIQVLGQLAGLLADSRKLKQILVNLLSNGIKFTEPGGVVRLSAFGRDDGGITFQITDTGIGIASADIPIAMTQFGQVGDLMTRNHVGTGIGLPLTKALVGQHGAKMTLESEVGVGTTVTVDFPPSRTVRPGDTARLIAKSSSNHHRWAPT